MSLKIQCKSWLKDGSRRCSKPALAGLEYCHHHAFQAYDAPQLVSYRDGEDSSSDSDSESIFTDDDRASSNSAAAHSHGLATASPASSSCVLGCCGAGSYTDKPKPKKQHEEKSKRKTKPIAIAHLLPDPVVQVHCTVPNCAHHHQQVIHHAEKPATHAQTRSQILAARLGKGVGKAALEMRAAIEERRRELKRDSNRDAKVDKNNMKLLTNLLDRIGL